MSKKLERILNLLATLKETGRPLSAKEIRERVPGYPDGDGAFKRAFERDKGALRELGYVVETVVLPAAEGGVGYKIPDSSKGGIPDPGLTAEERAVMAVAIGAVRLFPVEYESDCDPGSALRYGAMKIGLDPASRMQARVLGSMVFPLDRAVVLVSAMADRDLVEFDYEKADGSERRRKVAPLALKCVNRNWYLAAQEVEGGPVKVFRVDRIRSEVRRLRAPEGFKWPDPGKALDRISGPPWMIGGGDSRTASIAVDSDLQGVAEGLFEGAATQADEGGRLVYRVEYRTGDALLECIGILREAAEVLAPEDLRSQYRARLAVALDRLEGRSRDAEAMRAVKLAQQARGLPDDSDEDKSASGGSRRQREEATERARRLVTLVPWLVRHPGCKVDEAAAKFGISRETLIRDLEITTMTGTHPYSPVDLVDISWSDDRIVVRSAEYLNDFAALRLEEVALLYSALKLAEKLPDFSDVPELKSGMAKLESVLGERAIEVEVSAGEDEFDKVARLRHATEERESVEIEYQSSSSERRTTRVVDPYRLFVYEGRWYLEAFCHMASETRVFKVSRISDISPTGERFSHPDETVVSGREDRDGRSGAALPGVTGWRIEGLHVELVMPPRTAGWFTSTYSVERAIELENGWIYIALKASTLLWAKKVLFGIADRIEVLCPEDLRSDLARSVKRALERHNGRGS